VTGTAIVTDSSSGLPPEFLKEWDITSVSRYVKLVDGTTHREDELDIDRFYQDLKRDEQTPTTTRTVSVMPAYVSSSVAPSC
jgi:fatty acid-binding protein DegV